MKFQVEVVCLDGTSQEQRHTVLTIERAELAMETLGMSLSEGKAMLSGVQDVVIAQQAREYLSSSAPVPIVVGYTRMTTTRPFPTASDS